MLETKYEANKGKGIERLSNHFTVSPKLFILTSAGMANPYAMVSRATKKMRFLGYEKRTATSAKMFFIKLPLSTQILHRIIIHF
jgi:hypothetical protein